MNAPRGEPTSYEDFILNKNLYPTEMYRVPEGTSTYKNKKIQDGMFLLVGTENVGFWGDDWKSTYQEYVPLLDFCTVTGERMETIKELLDALMLRNIEQHNITGIDKNQPLYVVAETVGVSLLEYGLFEYYNREVITLATAMDLLVRLGHIPRPVGWVG